jgi:hypothetical protein
MKFILYFPSCIWIYTNFGTFSEVFESIQNEFEKWKRINRPTGQTRPTDENQPRASWQPAWLARLKSPWRPTCQPSWEPTEPRAWRWPRHDASYARHVNARSVKIGEREKGRWVLALRRGGEREGGGVAVTPEGTGAVDGRRGDDRHPCPWLLNLKWFFQHPTSKFETGLFPASKIHEKVLRW